MKNSIAGKEPSNNGCPSNKIGVNLLEEEEEEATVEEENLENDQIFADTIAKTASLPKQDNFRLTPRTVNPKIVTDIGSYFIKGQCQHGFSGKKEIDGKKWI